MGKIKGKEKKSHEKQPVFKQHASFNVQKWLLWETISNFFNNATNIVLLRHLTGTLRCWVSLATHGCVTLPSWGSLLVLMMHGELNWLLFPTPSVCIQLCHVDGFWRAEQPPLAASGMIYGTVAQRDNVCRENYLQLCKYPHSRYTSYLFNARFNIVFSTKYSKRSSVISTVFV